MTFKRKHQKVPDAAILTSIDPGWLLPRGEGPSMRFLVSWSRPYEGFPVYNRAGAGAPGGAPRLGGALVLSEVSANASPLLRK